MIVWSGFLSVFWAVLNKEILHLQTYYPEKCGYCKKLKYIVLHQQNYISEFGQVEKAP